MVNNGSNSNKRS